MTAAVLVPVKAFGDAKGRLAPVLSPAERARLAQAMAEHVVAAAAPLPVVVVCDHEGVRAWAEQVGARPLWTPGLGLDGAVEAGIAVLAAEGVARVVVAHSDLPLAPPGALAALGQPPAAGPDAVVVVPDRHDDGTNVISLPADAGFRFGYGHGSSGRHRAEAGRLGLPVQVLRDDALAWDVDLPADLEPPGGLPAHLRPVDPEGAPCR